jgi:NitT/TauT family transport system substrate-binding protein
MDRTVPRRRLLVLSISLAALALGCPRASDKDAPSGGGVTTVKLQLNWVAEPEFGGFYAAREGGAFKRAGLDVQIAGGAAGVPVVQMVATGQADFGVTGADDIITARARGADVVPVFATYQTAPQGIMVHASRGASSIADVLASGTLAIEPGTAFGIFLRKKHGFDKTKIVPYDGGVARFVADKDFAQQCYVTSEPLAAKKLGADPKVFLIADDGYDPYQTVVFTRRALWKEKPELVRAFARAVREGWRAYLDEPGPTNVVMAKLDSAMDAGTFAAVAAVQKPLIETDETKRGKLGMMTRERWELLGKQLVQLGVVPAAPPVDELLVPIGD